MQFTELQRDEIESVIARWSAEGTRLCCIAGLQPDIRVPEMFVHLPACVVTFDEQTEVIVMLVADSGSFFLISDWDGAAEVQLHTSWRGTMIEVVYEHGSVLIADYDCSEHLPVANIPL